MNCLLARSGWRRAMGNDGLAAAEKTLAVQHDNPSAAAAPDLYIRTCPDNSPFIGTAGMGFTGGDDVADKNLFNHGILNSED